jgi:hypothetical protein
MDNNQRTQRDFRSLSSEELEQIAKDLRGEYTPATREAAARELIPRLTVTAGQMATMLLASVATFGFCLLAMAKPGPPAPLVFYASRRERPTPALHRMAIAVTLAAR